jgi:hypothetical protein
MILHHIIHFSQFDENNRVLSCDEGRVGMCTLKKYYTLSVFKDFSRIFRNFVKILELLEISGMLAWTTRIHPKE